MLSCKHRFFIGLKLKVISDNYCMIKNENVNIFRYFENKKFHLQYVVLFIICRYINYVFPFFGNPHCNRSFTQMTNHIIHFDKNNSFVKFKPSKFKIQLCNKLINKRRTSHSTDPHHLLHLLAPQVLLHQVHLVKQNISSI